MMASLLYSCLAAALLRPHPHAPPRRGGLHPTIRMAADEPAFRRGVDLLQLEGKVSARHFGLNVLGRYWAAITLPFGLGRR